MGLHRKFVVIEKREGRRLRFRVQIDPPLGRKRASYLDAEPLRTRAEADAMANMARKIYAIGRSDFVPFDVRDL